MAKTTNCGEPTLLFAPALLQCPGIGAACLTRFPAGVKSLVTLGLLPRQARLLPHSQRVHFTCVWCGNRAGGAQRPFGTPSRAPQSGVNAADARRAACSRHQIWTRSGERQKVWFGLKTEPQHGDGGCRLCCREAGNGRVIGHGFKTRSLPTVNLHPGVFPSSPFSLPQPYACSHVSVCVRVYVCAHVSMCPCVHRCTHACMRTCMRACVHACVSTYMSACIGTSIYLCMCACTCIYTHVSACICMHIYVFVCLCISMHIHTYICMHVYTNLYM